jgi:hypothetical protein
MKYDVDYFIKKFEAIPSEKWCRGQIMEFDYEPKTGERIEKFCMLGHCGLEKMDNVIEEIPEEVKALFDVFGIDIIDKGWEKVSGDKCVQWSPMYRINDSREGGASPKDNVLNRLYEIKAE